MSQVGYTCTTEGAVALSAATAKTVIGVKSHANHGLTLTKFRVAFDGVTASAVPVLVELCYCTWATNSPGTASTSTTIRQRYGRAITMSATAGKTWTTEPTVLTVSLEWLLSPNGGLVLYDFPLGTAPDCAVSEGFALRLTAPATVNARATFEFERC